MCEQLQIIVLFNLITEQNAVLSCWIKKILKINLYMYIILHETDVEFLFGVDLLKKKMKLWENVKVICKKCHTHTICLPNAF